MKSLPKLLAFALACSFGAACGDDGINQTPDAPPGGDPPVPALGDQVDRAGRAAISSALVGTFDFLPGGGDKTATKNAYNADANVAGWIDTYQAGIKAHVAIYDALDTAAVTGCNNAGNLLANLDLGNGEGRYDVLATVLADDRMYINSESGTCGDGGYLAVEANFALDLGLPDCGGRTPTMDVVATSYTALASGLATAVDDGVTEDGDGVRPDNDTFPFLAAP